MHGELQLSDNAIAELDAVVPNFPGHFRSRKQTFEQSFELGHIHANTVIRG